MRFSLKAIFFLKIYAESLTRCSDSAQDVPSKKHFQEKVRKKVPLDERELNPRFIYFFANFRNARQKIDRAQLPDDNS